MTVVQEMQPGVDRRVIRTKRYIRDALTELIEEKGFEQITVSDITSRADINRGTFYTHYHDKNDLMQKSEDEIIADIMEIQEQLAATRIEDVAICHITGKPLPYIVSLYDYLRVNGAFLSALLGPKGDPAFSLRLRDVVAKNLVEKVLNEKYRDNVTPLTEYYLSYYTAAQLGVITHWFETGMKETSEEMSRITLSIMYMQLGDKIELHGAKGDEKR